ncbi:MAG TPA: hypothetical protein VF779_20255 [Pyrinomonadaceae bacterium]
MSRLQTAYKRRWCRRRGGKKVVEGDSVTGQRAWTARPDVSPAAQAERRRKVSMPAHNNETRRD